MARAARSIAEHITFWRYRVLRTGTAIDTLAAAEARRGNMIDSDSDEPIGVVGTGTWRDLLPRIPRPVFVIGAHQLYRVLLHGSGFSLPLSHRTKPISGFFATRFVAASNVRDAEIKARSSVLAEWKRGGYEDRAGHTPTLELEDIEIVHSRFRLRSGGGFTFFSASPGN